MSELGRCCRGAMGICYLLVDAQRDAVLLDFGRTDLFLRGVRSRRMSRAALEAGRAEIAVRGERAALVPSAGTLS